MTNDPSTLWTIGQSTRALEAFLALVDDYRIGAMAGSLPEHGIAYEWTQTLGGRRKV